MSKKVLFFIFILFFSLYLPAQSLTDSLKIHLKLDGNLMDSSGNGFHFSGPSSIKYIPFFQSDSAIEFNGSNGVSMQSNFVNQTTFNEVSISLWFKSDYKNPSNRQVMVQGAFMATVIHVATTNLIGGTFEVPTASQSFFDSKSRLDNKWHHLVLQNNGDTSFLYVDGRLQNQKAQKISGRSNNKLYLGRTNLNTNHFKGAINDFRYYSRLLSQNEIGSLSTLPEINDTIDTTSCTPYTSPSGNLILTETGQFRDTTENLCGIQTFHLINFIRDTLRDSLTVNQCGNYRSPSGKHLWDSTGIYRDTITDSLLCSKTFLINLKIDTLMDTLNPSSCGSYLSPSGKHLWDSSGTYNDTVVDSLSCVKAIIVNLTISNDSIDGKVIFANNILFNQSAGNSSFQWLNCDSGFAPILGKTKSFFKPPNNGNYAVEIRNNGCIDTSDCINVLLVGLEEKAIADDKVSIYPNPSNGQFMIQMDRPYSNLKLSLFNVKGQLIQNQSIPSATETIHFSTNTKPGLYFLWISENNNYLSSSKVIIKY